MDDEPDGRQFLNWCYLLSPWQWKTYRRPRISHRVYVMGHGRMVFEGTPDELSANAGIRRVWLEV